MVKRVLDFKKAVFTIENAWYDHKLTYSDFDQKIGNIAFTCQDMIKNKGIERYKTAGNWAIFMLMTQKIPENNQQPFVYDFDDFLGNNDYTNTFVSTLLLDKKGTCLSLPILYKCICSRIECSGKTNNWSFSSLD